MEREYIKIKKPFPLPDYTSLQRKLDDDVWKNMVFYHLLMFYKNYNETELRGKILLEQTKANPRIERQIAEFFRIHLRNSRQLNLHGFKVVGESTNDEEVEGNYDIVISHSYWTREFHFECKNLTLDSKKGLVSKYVCYNRGKLVFDGGVYRYFNGKYAQHQNFGGMIGFVLSGDSMTLKNKIIERLNLPFDISPEGDLKSVTDNSIEGNDFTFDSVHTRFGSDFTIHHLLLDFKLF